jgi:hypothetical protein
MIEQQNADAIARERVLQRLTAQEGLAMRQEQAAREQAERDARAEIFAQADAAESRAIADLRTLQARYNERAELARAAIAAIAEFAKCELAIVAELTRVDDNLAPFWARTVVPQLRLGRWAGLRASAGLNESHRYLGIAAPRELGAKIAAVCLLGILRGAITAGAIIAGGKHLAFCFDDAREI